MPGPSPIPSRPSSSVGISTARRALRTGASSRPSTPSSSTSAGAPGGSAAGTSATAATPVVVLTGLSAEAAAAVRAFAATLRPLEVPAGPWRFGAAINAARGRRGISQAQLAGMVQTTEPYISQLETGRRRTPSDEVVRRICLALGLSWTRWVVEVNRARSPVLAEALAVEAPPLRAP